MKVLILVVERLPLRFVGCYGSDWVETPGLDRLAAEGVVFDEHFADRPDATGACRAWRTGRYHFPLPDSSETPAPSSEPDVIQCLRDSGIVTYLVTMSEDRDLVAGWEHRLVVTPSSAGEALEQTLEATEQAIGQLALMENWLLWVELTMLLPPWNIPPEFVDRYFQPREEEADEAATPLTDLPVGRWENQDDAALLQLQNSYAAAVSYLDAGIEWLYERLLERKLLDDLLVVVTTDRGLALGEHGIVGDYRPWLHDELIHLPLIVRLPAGAEAGRRVASLTQSVDLFPTLLDAFALPAAPVHGRTLMPLLRGAAKPLRAYACAGHKIGKQVEWALRTPEWSYLLPLQVEPDDPPRLPQLYVKPDDRWEMNNVIQHHLELAEQMEQTLRGFVTATRQPGPLQAPPLGDVESALDRRPAADGE